MTTLESTPFSLQAPLASVNGETTETTYPSYRTLPKITPVSVEDTVVVSNRPEESFTRVPWASITLNSGLQIDEVVRADILCSRAFNNLEVAEGRKFDGEVLQCLGRLVDEKDVKHDIELVNLIKLVKAGGTEETWRTLT
jgi:hypothetical protein